MKTIVVKSRYGDVRSFVPVRENIYKFGGQILHCRFGGNDMKDLEFFDPDGGPFISAGYSIGGRKVVRIMAEEDGIYFEVE